MHFKTKNSFPYDDYTPFGYLDNPYHSWKLNRSGIIRVHPPVGMGWAFPNVRDPIYRVAMNIGLKIDNNCILLAEDFQRHKIELISHYHSKDIFNIYWEWQQLQCDTDFFLSDENTISCLINIYNRSTIHQKIELLLQNSVFWNYGRMGLWDFGLSGKFDDGIVIKSFAEGACFILRPNCEFSPFHLSDSLELKSINHPPYFSSRSNSIFGIISIPLKIDPQEKVEIHCNLSRGLTELQARSNLNKILKLKKKFFNTKLETDHEFWNQCPQLVGAWPAHWRHGWVYDWETIRMNVRNPIGFYTTHWDAMQIQKPRVVLAETALDMMMMSYAQPAVSKEVIFGMFRDAVGPQVPCSREDGSLNMIAEDGSECGTSPAWCFPFLCFQSILMRNFDYDWLAKLYPYLEQFLDWWLKNRTDEEGWGIYKCSWESGQDASAKFHIEQSTGGELVEHICAVDLQTGMALSMKIMAFFSTMLGKNPEKWKHWQDKFNARLNTMWQGNWFCDFDKRNQSWINVAQYRDITNLAPFLLEFNSQNRIDAIKPQFEYFKNNPKLWLEWASFFFMYIEACWQIDFKDLAATVLFDKIDQVYRNWDRRSWTEGEPMPGISIECWGIDQPYGSEGYGWAATLPLHIIRSIIGYRECEADFQHQFSLTPNFPEQLLKENDEFGIKNLKFQDKTFSINYKIFDANKIEIFLEIESRQPFLIQVLQMNDNTVVVASKSWVKKQAIKFYAANRTSFLVKFPIQYSNHNN